MEAPFDGLLVRISNYAQHIPNSSKHIPNSSKHILNSLQILKSSQHISKSSQHISNLHNTFRNLHNTFAPGPQVLAEKKERLRNSSFFLRRQVLFTCGESLQVSFKFCPKCGKDLANNKEIKVGDETSRKKNLSFNNEIKETKEKQRATFFRKK